MKNLRIYFTLLGLLFALFLLQPTAKTSGQTVEPDPKIKVNGQEGQVNVTKDTQVILTVENNAGSYEGVMADWWIYANLPDSVYSLDSSLNWIAGESVTYTGPLFSFGSYTLFSGGLQEAPTGVYSFYFKLDMTPNGILDGQVYSGNVSLSVTESDLVFYPDSGFRRGFGTSNPMAGISPDNKIYLYYNDDGVLSNTSGEKIAISTDGLTFGAGAVPSTYQYHPKFVLMPDGVTRRTYMPAGASGSSVIVSKSFIDGANATDDSGVRYYSASIDKGTLGITEVFPDNTGGYVMLYIGDLYGANNIRRAYSSPGDNGMNFSFTTANILGDASRPKGSDRNVDQFTYLLPDGRRRLIAMAYSGKQIDSYITSDYGTTFTQESGSRLTVSDFEEFTVYSLHDPTVVRLSDGRYRMYVCARVDKDESAPEGSKDRYAYVIVSATTR